MTWSYGLRDAAHPSGPQPITATEVLIGMLRNGDGLEVRGFR